MATNHTTNYNLNLWEASDKFVREEFNENSTKIDAAIKAVDAKADTKADAAALTAETTARTSAINSLTQAVNQRAQVAAGYYTGNGAASRSIYTGFTPKAVLVMLPGGTIYSSSSFGGSSCSGGLAVTGQAAGSTNAPTVQIFSGGFTVFTAETYVHSNDSGVIYNYLAIG